MKLAINLSDSCLRLFALSLGIMGWAVQGTLKIRVIIFVSLNCLKQ